MSDAANNGVKDGTEDLDLLATAVAHLNIQDSLRLALKESGSTSRVDSLSASNPECLVDDVSLPSLPEEVITEILVCLPVKSLLRFKCVSKPWLSLISDPQFIRSHFSKSSSSMDEAEGANLELLFVTETGMKKCSLYSALHETNVCTIEYQYRNYRPIVGIINGLVCLDLGISGTEVDGTDLCVWNPALNKVKNFNFHPQAPSPRRHLGCLFSFGYDESNDDYKVLCFEIADIALGGVDAEGYIYSLKADSWRRVSQLDLEGGFRPYEPGVFANGKIYLSCLSVHAFPIPMWKHLSLDMSSDELVELQPPEYDAGNRSLQMGVSGGRPVVLCDYCEGKKVDLWLLDTHGVEESWCKMVSFLYTDVNHGMYYFNYRVLCISSNGGIVFGSQDGLLVYDWKKKRSRHIKLVVGMRTHWDIAAYVESLVWPNYV